MSTAAIYSRKSLFTGKGESIQNQIDACKEYALRKGWHVIEYYDEGFSGKDTDRPGFQTLLSDIEKGMIDHVIFYKLDRISRRMLDILEFIERINSKGIDFVSITENFDTTTPLGRAMVHIAATFAQLEREMLQQRVRDNMLRLAKTGRWLGGITPTGYTSTQEKYIDERGKEKVRYRLLVKEDELEIVKLIYRKYLALHSLTKLEKYMMDQGIKSKNDCYYQKQTLRAILTNPVYVKADIHTYYYFEKMGLDIADPPEAFDGTHGVLSYNKNEKGNKKNNILRDPSQWIISLSSHSGIIESKDWIRVQKLLLSNREKAPRQQRSHYALLTGLLKCGLCGASMKVKFGQKSMKTGKRFYYYVCQTKEISSGKLCNCANVRGDWLDQAIMNRLTEFNLQEHIIQRFLNDVEKEILKNNHRKDIVQHQMKNQIKQKEDAIYQLVQQLEQNPSPLSIPHIHRRIEALDREINTLREQSPSQKDSSHYWIDQPQLLCKIKKELKSLSCILKHLDDVELKRRLVSSVVDKVYWHPGKIDLVLHGAKYNERNTSNYN